ncbi:MAG: nitrite/sulfite reductase [Leptospirales bacterium]|nr:nitrite/sulfite reductase [Leptospirales bacterium]
MKASNDAWSQELGPMIREDWAREIDIFETELRLRKQGKFDEKLFAETRLRRGAYGQRYDNGLRHDGIAQQNLAFPEAPTKGPMTQWYAPGMMRIKVPYGGLTPQQLETMAELAEDYSDGIAHVTTRQDFQLHFVLIEDAPALMRRLAAVGITTREACGNSVRNVTGCAIAGVCREEAFDISPYARALTFFLLGHQDVQDFGRKFKISFSGCAHNGCGLANMHDLGMVARTRVVDGLTQRGFQVFVGGGLGAVPHSARVLYDFLPVEELLPMAQAVSRVFARLGEKKNRARARVKFLVAKLGDEEFRRLVQEERKVLPSDPRWTAYLTDLPEATEEKPSKPGSALASTTNPEMLPWQKSNVYAQKQEGYSTVTVKLPLGDITAAQLRALADIARRYTPGAIRTTVEQNMVLRWISNSDLPALFAELQAAKLAGAGAEGIRDVVACPGTDTCKLGISASRGLAGELMRRFSSGDMAIDETIERLKIKISGCFNSCSQHHLADLGFYGVARKVGAHTVPHFQVVLGGQWSENGGAYGLPILAVPSRRIPQVIERIADRFRKERQAGETFQLFIKRIGKVSIKQMLDDLTAVPEHASDRSLYSDWRDPREYSTGDMGVGECAGEVVTRIDFDLAAAEREVFEAQLLLDSGNNDAAAKRALRAMLQAARGLVRLSYLDVPETPAVIIEEFRKRLYDTQLFFDPFAGGKFAHFLFSAFERADEPADQRSAHHRVEEAGLFVEAAHACNLRQGDRIAQSGLAAAT